uniref:Mucin-21 n=1 Tax=Castor canadensis TaxID=51338 RepID=A0A8B7TYU6_CASCN|nr:mucin-21 [Castor canadensis]
MEEKAEIIKWVRMGILKISRELAIDVMMRSRKASDFCCFVSSAYITIGKTSSDTSTANAGSSTISTASGTPTIAGTSPNSNVITTTSSARSSVPSDGTSTVASTESSGNNTTSSTTSTLTSSGDNTTSSTAATLTSSRDSTTSSTASALISSGDSTTSSTAATATSSGASTTVYTGSSVTSSVNSITSNTVSSIISHRTSMVSNTESSVTSGETIKTSNSGLSITSRDSSTPGIHTASNRISTSVATPVIEVKPSGSLKSWEIFLITLVSVVVAVGLVAGFFFYVRNCLSLRNTFDTAVYHPHGPYLGRGSSPGGNHGAPHRTSWSRNWFWRKPVTSVAMEMSGRENCPSSS